MLAKTNSDGILWSMSTILAAPTNIFMFTWTVYQLNMQQFVAMSKESIPSNAIIALATESFFHKLIATALA